MMFYISYSKVPTCLCELFSLFFRVQEDGEQQVIHDHEANQCGDLDMLLSIVRKLLMNYYPMEVWRWLSTSKARLKNNVHICNIV